MSMCLRHYYDTRDPLGAGGDFTTAPEISQMFGELIGLWMLEIWQAMGSPAPCRLIELGPGRGTLMADFLRATRLIPDFQSSVTVHLVETSSSLHERQRQMLATSGFHVTWHTRIEDVPEGPALLVANEFFDALPVRQFQATDRGWCERLVGLNDDRFVFGLRPEPEAALGKPPHEGAILEWPAASIDLMKGLSHRFANEGGAALIIDYGYWGPVLGDTLQALKRHDYHDPLYEPGEADLTTHVDFHHIAESAGRNRVRIHGPAMQGDFLDALGIAARAAALKQRATPAQAADIDSALSRLTARGPTEMGELFKVLAISHADIEAVPGLAPLQARL
ncbi:class I SAM-dependent methyltransferase [Microvirga sp. c23x22]|uniref:Class I SAM-dependent methyltransferase n=2 Tax=Microvirga terricola TaxID=2719797 RepID=A0ABX0V8U0_9HYPH|nr:SAM-dependent methyltransferase [Microvirga terricola]NIX76270.1 class I SAM-dependent methyltransferase [Microvirga terricola]